MKTIKKVLLSFTVSTLVLLICLGGVANAFSSAATIEILNRTPFYDGSQATTCQISTATDLSGTDNEEKIFRFLLGKGLTNLQAAAIMGNISVESGFDPKEIEAGVWGGKKWGGESDSIPPSVGPQGQPGYGLVQWTSPDRKKGLGDLAAAQNPPVLPSDLGVQLDFMWSELTNSPYKDNTLDPLKQITTSTDPSQVASELAAATLIVQRHYEVGGGDDARLKAAKKIYALYSSITPTDAGVVVAAPGGNCSDSVGPGQNTKYTSDGFIVYSQYDPAWKDHPYSTSTVGVSGCGPSAMAMIITALTGTRVTPDETADYAGAQKQYVSGAGSKWSISPVLAAHWNLKSTPVKSDVADITAALQAGQLVIAPGQGALPYTKGGHFIVVRGVKDGKFLIGDSGHTKTSDEEWDPTQLVNEMHDGGAYAIYN